MPRFIPLALAFAATAVPAPAHGRDLGSRRSRTARTPTPAASIFSRSSSSRPKRRRSQTLAYQAEFPGLGRALRIARRSVPVGTLLEDGAWTFSDAHYLQPDPPSVPSYARVDLAVDRVTATPYVIFVDRHGHQLELSRWVGDGNGTCGEGFDWVCEDVLSACGMEEHQLGGAYNMPYRIELESELDSPADAAHVMLYVDGPTGNDLVHARRDLDGDSWTCQVLAECGAGQRDRHAVGLDLSRVRRAPQAADRLPDRGWAHGRLEVIRSLLDYAGTPLPPLSWTSRVGGAYNMPYRIELESELDSPADAAHVMLYVDGPTGNDLVHARRDLDGDSWTCQVLPSAGPVNGIGMQSVSIFHEYDARLKPQIAYPIAGGRTGRLEVIRSLLDYAGTPLPPLSWTAESTIAPAGYPNYGTPALAVRDEGLGGQGEAFLTGIGVPALVEVRRDSHSLPPWPSCDEPGTWTMDYRVAEDFAGSSWSAPETIVAGRPCGPAMAFGWDMNPYVIYRDEAQDTLMLTTRRHDVAQPWTEPQTIGDSPTWSDIVFDPDRGTISIVYREYGAESFTVTDGFMHETL